MKWNKMKWNEMEQNGTKWKNWHDKKNVFTHHINFRNWTHTSDLHVNFNN